MLPLGIRILCLLIGTADGDTGDCGDGDTGDCGSSLWDFRDESLDLLELLPVSLQFDFRLPSVTESLPARTLLLDESFLAVLAVEMDRFLFGCGVEDGMLMEK